MLPMPLTFRCMVEDASDGAGGPPLLTATLALGGSDEGLGVAAGS